MDFERILHSERRPLLRRLRRMVGSQELAEDLQQETLARAWRSAPREAEPEQVRAWLHRVASNLAVDELRRAARRPADALLDDSVLAAPSSDPDEAIAARESLERMTAHERMLLLLRFEAGLTYQEMAELLDISAAAARQRLARARRSFSELVRPAQADRPPRIYLLMGDDPPEPYLEWLRSAGADARTLEPAAFERSIASADGLVITGSRRDVHPSLYGEQARWPLVTPDAGADRRDAAAIRSALEHDVPLIGICRGHQLLNIVLGGSLYQDVSEDPSASGHLEHHQVDTANGTLARRLLGRTARVTSRHHQAVNRLGGGLRVSSRAADGLVEAIELPRRRFALGIQFHPEDRANESDARLAEALVDAAARRAA